MTLNEKDYIATRLGVRVRPARSGFEHPHGVQHFARRDAQAFKALRDGECDMALAGGIAITAPTNSGIVYNEGGMYSPDGSTRTFDAQGKRHLIQRWRRHHRAGSGLTTRSATRTTSTPRSRAPR
ncbi:MAG: beta-ketoacyl synthase N-terminal-like domain-containing protein [Flavobacteriales bacterium]